MKMIKSLRVLILFMTNILLVKCKYFSVVAPATLRLGEPYQVAVTSHDYEKPLEVKLSVKGISQTGEYIENVKTVLVNSSETVVNKFRFLDLQPGYYNFHVDAANFSKSAPLFFNPQKSIVLIEIDSITYKTSDHVNFRVIAINSRTKPYSDKNKNKIRFLDPQNNQLRVWKNVNFDNGIYENHFEFHDLTPGIYEMLAEVDETITSRKFVIKKRNKGLTKISLDAPKKVSFRNGFIDIKIHIKSLRRSQISGKLKLICKIKDDKIFEKNLQASSSEIELSISFLNDLKLFELNESEDFILIAKFIDDKTKEEFEATTTFSILVSDYSVQILNSAKHFKVGLPFAIFLNFKNSNSKAESAKITIENDKHEKLVSRKIELEDKSQSVKIETPIILSNTSSLKIDVICDKILYSMTVYEAKSLINESIALNLLTERPELNKTIEFEIMTTNVHQKFAVFQLVSKGLLRVSQKISIHNGRAKFDRIVKFSYTPRAYCVVYYINNDGRIISDSLVVSFKNILPNYVNITLDQNVTQPGGKNRLKISTTSNSTVGLIAFEKGSTKFDSSTLNSELLEFNYVPFSDISFDADTPLWYFPFSFKKIFLHANLHLLTNAVEDVMCDESFKSENMIDEFISEELISNEKMDQCEITQEPPSQKFLFNTLKINNSGEEIMEFTSPTLNPSEWTFSAMTLSDKNGIGLTTELVDLKIFKTFYVEVFAPTKLKVFEIGLIEIFVYNWSEKDLQVYVEFKYKNFILRRALAYNWTESEFGVAQNILVPSSSVYRLNIEITYDNPQGLSSYYRVVASTFKDVEKIRNDLNFMANSVTKTELKLISLDKCMEKLKLDLKCPKGQSGSVSITGDIMGITLATLDEIINIPSGSALETLNTFAMNVYLLDYMAMTEQLTPFLKTKAVIYLQTTFQKLMMYRNHDGSFREFREVYERNLWVTANVVKILSYAERYISIKDEVITEGLTFISSQQSLNGEFKSEKKEENLIYTSFIAATLDEFTHTYPQYQSNVEKAVEYIEHNFELCDGISLAFSTHFLFQTDSRLRLKFLKKFASYAQKSLEHVFWNISDKSPHFNVIATAYGLLIYDQIPELYSEAFKILSWLITQQSSGFSSFHASLIALEAISKFGARFGDYGVDMNVTMGEEKIELKSSSKLFFQSFKTTLNESEIIMKGYGNAIVQLSCTDLFEPEEYSNELLSVALKDGSCLERLQISISLSSDLKFTSGVGLINFEIPSGYRFHSENKTQFLEVKDIMQTLSLKIYFNSENLNFDIVLIRYFLIFNHTSYIVSVEDLNDKAQKSSIFYTLPKSLKPCASSIETEMQPIFDSNIIQPLRKN